MSCAGANTSIAVPVLVAPNRANLHEFSVVSSCGTVTSTDGDAHPSNCFSSCAECGKAFARTHVHIRLDELRSAYSIQTGNL